ncbi:MAG: hypothetical protein OHK0047_11720 [Leptolyngbyaceae cyanobacterium]
MAATPGKRSKATLVKKEMVEEANSFLQDLPEKQKEDLSLKEAVNKLREPIQEALAKGYSYPDLAKMLSEKGIKISALTLKNYAPSGRKQSSKAKAKPRRAKKVQSGSVASIESVSDESDSSEAAETPTPRSRRGGRTAGSRTTSTKSTGAKTTRRATSTAKTGAKSTSRRRKSTAAE